ncbi:MAG: DNA polymerase III subunit delta' [Nitrospira sp.]|nr:DNA polymerase III subunit delta' [bacterium]MBL7048446.1 DNA polymerase III subunit delta' [Nitrospira sp.]
MALKDVIGQEKAINILKGCIGKKRIPHAFLFAGEDGIGKKLTAVNFAKALNCGRKKDSSLFSFDDVADAGLETEACDICPSCTKIDSGNHPDFFLIEPESAGKQITVASIRQLEESLSYRPYEGEWKIAIVDQADMLNPSAANAFLKTLEEPSSQSIIILISARPEVMLPTIRSRCQRVNFTPLPPALMSGILESRHEGVSRDLLQLQGLLSGGRLGYAINGDLIERRDWSLKVLQALLSGPDEEVWDSRESMEDWFKWVEMWLRDLAVLKATGDPGLLINRDRADELGLIIINTELKDILNLTRDINNIKVRLGVNLNKQITLNYASLLLKETLGKSNARR